jgi:threonine dehydrogenase-like Zn-dependent dehydrogenase
MRRHEGADGPGLRSARPGGQVGFVGVPGGGPELSGAIQPGRVFDTEMPLTDVAAAYAAMDERRAIKVLLRPLTPAAWD